MRKIFSIIAVLAVALALMLPAGMVLAAGTTLTAGLDVTVHWTLTYHWTIDKSVTPATWDLFVGDTGTSKYTITVTKDAGTEEAWVDGTIWVTNGGAVATENLAITAVLKDGYEPPNDFLASAPVDVSGNPVLDPGETGYYSYHVNMPAYDLFGNPQPRQGHTYKVQADVTITNHAGHIGTPYGPSPSETALCPARTVVNDSINVDDTNGGSWPFSNSGSVSYEKTFECTEPGQEIYDNTATIRQTGQSDGARVTVNNYELEVSKTAQASFTRTYYWDIDKSADQSALTLSIGQQFLVNYLVCVDATYADSDWLVAGTLAIHNPAPIAAELIGVADEVSPDIAAVADFGAITFPYTLDAEGDVAGTYVADLPDASSRTNTFTATIQNYAYKWDGSAPPTGTTTFSGTADVDFGTAQMEEIDECITVDDTYSGGPQEVVWCYDDGVPHCFGYSRWIGPYGTCGDYTVDNTASFITNDTGTTGSDGWTVAVHVPCGGCTLTIGYWKTHAGFGPQPDMVTALLPRWLGTAGGATSIQVTTAALAVQFLGFKGSNNVFDASNGINKLYAQLLGAKLNIANGADGSAVATTIASADAFLATKNSLNWASLSKAQKNQVLNWMTTLDRYNNGLIGPGHCSE